MLAVVAVSVAIALVVATVVTAVVAVAVCATRQVVGASHAHCAIGIVWEVIHVVVIVVGSAFVVVRRAIHHHVVITWFVEYAARCGHKRHECEHCQYVHLCFHNAVVFLILQSRCLLNRQPIAELV